MKPLLLNTFDLAGGAARAAYRLHCGLQQIGCASTMLVAYKSSDDATVIEAERSRRLPHRLVRRLYHEQIEYERGRYRKTRPDGYELFSDDRSTLGSDLMRSLPLADLLNLHWVAGFVDLRRLLQAVPQEIPIVWTLHDMNAFTGGCHYDDNCGKFASSCGACPQLGSHRDNDLSRAIWQRKQQAYQSAVGSCMHIVALSHWMAGEVSRSLLLGNHKISIIPNGLPTEIFAPRHRASTRKTLGLNADDRVVMFAADWTINRRKGRALLVEALSGLRERKDVVLLTAGSGEQPDLPGLRQICVGPIQDDLRLAELYSAADLFVIPSLQDNLPNTVLEAMACGIPVVGFATGGIPDMVRPGQTGLLAPVGDVAGLRAAIIALLDDDDLRQRMALRCRQIAVTEYALEVQARRYNDLYTELIALQRQPAVRSIASG